MNLELKPEVAQELGKLLSKAKSDAKATQAATQKSSQLEAERQRIAGLLRSGQFAAAISALEQMAQCQDAGAEQYAV